MRKYRKRIHYTETDKALMWDRWRKGDSLKEGNLSCFRPNAAIQVIESLTEASDP
jgi:hypothetical protein